MPTTDTADTPDGHTPDPPTGIAQATAEQRGEPRFRVQWHVAVSLDGRDICHAYTKDVSTKGATLYLEHNPQKFRSVSLRIQVPPLSEGAAPHLIDVEGNIVYAIHDSDALLFRAGIQFGRFISESDRDFLESRLKSYPQTVSD